MTIATLPPSNHVNALRVFIQRIRRTRTLPTGQELAHAEESLDAIGKHIRSGEA
jgi:hypothetical protein